MRLGDVTAPVLHSAAPARGREAHGTGEGFHAALNADDQKRAAQKDTDDAPQTTTPPRLEDSEPADEAICDDCIDTMASAQELRQSESPDRIPFGSAEARIRLDLSAPKSPDPVTEGQVSRDSHDAGAPQAQTAPTDYEEILNPLFPAKTPDRIPSFDAMHGKEEVPIARLGEGMMRDISKKDPLSRPELAVPRVGEIIRTQRQEKDDVPVSRGNKTSEIDLKNSSARITIPEVLSLENSQSDGEPQAERLTNIIQRESFAAELSQRINDQITSEIAKHLRAEFTKPQTIAKPDHAVDIAGDKLLKKLQVSLHPIELGKVRILFSATDGGTQINFIVERSETLELMRRYAQNLMKDLEKMGLENLSLGFSSNRDHKPQNRPDYVLQGTLGFQEGEATLSKPEEIRAIGSSIGSVDIRV